MDDALKQAREDVVDVIRSWDDQTAADAALDRLEAAVRADQRRVDAQRLEDKMAMIRGEKWTSRAGQMGFLAGLRAAVHLVKERP